jgi:glycosyltransferase involved in cell wall biosynthesis
MSSELISIVMPSLNQAAYIGEAIESVLSQSYENIELIVADGGSTDETLDLLRNKANQESRVRWHSEQDTGPANAINKALGRVRGTVIGWLNSDDLYTPGAIDRAATFLKANPQDLMVYGQGQHIDAAGQYLHAYPTLPPSTPVEKFSEGCFICQPTVFFRRTLFVLLGNLDETLSCAFDFDYWLRTFKNFPDRIGFLDTLQASSRLHGDCITMRMRQRVALEGMKVLHRYLGVAPKDWLITYAEELLSLPPHERGVADLHTHLAETLAASRCFVTTQEYAELEVRIRRLLR